MLLRRVARPLLAAPFVYDGVQAVLHPAEHVEAARPLTDKVTARLGVAPLSDPHLTMAVRIHGGMTAVLGVALGAGFFPRVASVKLAALTAPLAVVHEPFTSKGEVRQQRMGRFVRTVGYVGAALIAGVDLEGRPGISWRVSNARKQRAKAHTAE